VIDITGLDKAEVLCALYNNARFQGLGYLCFKFGPLNKEEAMTELLHSGYKIDYLHGRVLKINLLGDEFDELLYDRDNSEGQAEKIIKRLREEGLM